MNVLLLNASPRGEASNTLLLAKAFVRGLGCSCETVTLAEKTVAPCTAGSVATDAACSATTCPPFWTRSCRRT